MLPKVGSHPSFASRSKGGRRGELLVERARRDGVQVPAPEVRAGLVAGAGEVARRGRAVLAPDPHVLQHLLPCLLHGPAVTGVPRLARLMERDPGEVEVLPWFNTEARAHTLRYWAPVIVPGILQTPAYALELFRAMRLDEAKVEEFMEIRLGRQEILTREEARDVYPGLPVAAIGIGLLREGQTHALEGGLFLGIGVLILGIGLWRYINHLRRPELFELVAVMGGKRRGLFTCRDHDFVWAIQDGLEKAMNTTDTMTTMRFTINGGQGLQFGNGNNQFNKF